MLVNKSLISVDLFWKFLLDVSNIIFKKVDQDKSDLYIIDTPNYFSKDSFLYESRLIRLLLLDHPSINPFRSQKLFTEKGKTTYLNITKLFINLPVGISSFCKVVYRFKVEFNSKVLLRFSYVIAKNSSNENYFNDYQTREELENLLLDIYYNNLNSLTSSDLIKLTDIISNFVIYTNSYKINYIYQQLLPSMYK